MFTWSFTIFRVIRMQDVFEVFALWWWRRQTTDYLTNLPCLNVLQRVAACCVTEYIVSRCQSLNLVIHCASPSARRKNIHQASKSLYVCILNSPSSFVCIAFCDTKYAVLLEIFASFYAKLGRNNQTCMRKINCRWRP